MQFKYTYKVFRYTGEFDENEFIGIFETNLRHKEAFNILSVIFDLEHSEHGIFIRRI